MTFAIIIIQPLYPHFVAHQNWYNSHSSYTALIWHSLKYPPLLHVQEWVAIDYQKGNIFIRSTLSDNESFGFSSKAVYRR